MGDKEFSFMCQMYFEELCSNTKLGLLKELAEKSKEMNHFVMIHEKLKGKVYETIDQFYGDLQYLCLDLLETSYSKYGIPKEQAPDPMEIQKIQTNIDVMYENYMNTNRVSLHQTRF